MATRTKEYLELVLETYLITARNHAMMAITMKGMRQPIAAPSLRSRPDLVKGIPILLLILALAWEIPRKRFQEKPPLFIDKFTTPPAGYF